MTPETRKLADDCFLHDKDRLRHHEALKILQDRMAPVADTTELPLSQAGGKILSQPVIAPRNIPAFDNSAVDGYAYAHADFERTGGFFPLTARIAAGDTDDIELPGLSAARIFTGARMPSGADTIAMQEDCKPHSQEDGNFIVIPGGLKAGANCRRAGEDVSKGETVAETGSRLRAQDLAAIASTGAASVSVYKPLRVGLLSSGNEILRPGEQFVNGRVYDSNHFMLADMLEKLGCDVTDLGIAPDQVDVVSDTLKSAAADHDVIISSGGASKGEEDHFITALEKHGKRHLWQLAVKPGRPMCFGQVGNTLCFTLPGNPVAAFVCFLLYVRPCLLRLGGAKWQTPSRYWLKAGFSIRSKPDRREFLRGYLQENADDAHTIVHKFNRDGSGLIIGLRESSGLIEIPEETTSVEAGEMVRFIPYSELGITG